MSSKNQVNKSRTEKIRAKSDGELKRIVNSGSLSAAAAAFELNRRNGKTTKDQAFVY